MAQALRRHIFTTCGHFRGRVESWDVVNEALAPDGTLADNVFLRKMGRGYIAQAFRWAREADPEALLLYNDNKVEGAAVPGASPPEAGLPMAPVADFYRKSDAMYALLQELLGALAPNSPLRKRQERLLRDAFRRRRTVWIDYLSTSDPLEGTVRREVAIWKMKTPRIQGWCYLREGERVFRLDRMREVTAGEQAYEVPPFKARI